MTTSISPISKGQISELISSLDGGRLSVPELEALDHFMFISQMIWAGAVDGRLLCLWGLIPPTLLSDQAYLWLHTTEDAKDHEFVLVRRSQIELKKMLEVFPRIIGHCSMGASQSIRWLKWLGATFGEPDGRLIPFMIRKE